MAIARFKGLCLDAGDPARLGVFWAAVLGRTWAAEGNGDGLVTGPTPQHTIWVNRVQAQALESRDRHGQNLACGGTCRATGGLGYGGAD